MLHLAWLYFTLHHHASACMSMLQLAWACFTLHGHASPCMSTLYLAWPCFTLCGCASPCRTTLQLAWACFTLVVHSPVEGQLLQIKLLIMFVYLSLSQTCFRLLEYMSWVTVVKSHECTLSTLRNRQTSFQNSCTILHLSPQPGRGPSYPMFSP